MVTTVASDIRGFLIPYAVHFRSLGWRVEALANGATTDDRIAASFDDAHDWPLSRSILNVRGMLRSTKSLMAILESGVDIVHVHTPIAAFVTRAAIRRLPEGCRPAVVYTAHGFHFHQHGRLLTNALFVTAEKLAGHWTDRLVVINDEDYAAAMRNRILPRRKICHMPGIGIDTRYYSRDSISPDAISRTQKQFHLRSEGSLFVVVGELNRNKRPIDVVAAMARMKHQDSKLLLLGDGPDRARVMAAVHDCGLSRRVRLAGFVPDVRPAVALSTAVILASTREGLPRSIMEALSMGVPVLSSSARGCRELVAPDAGIVVSTGDVGAMAAAMDWIVEHPTEAKAMGERGRERMVRKHDEPLLIAMHEALYGELLAENAHRHHSGLTMTSIGEVEKRVFDIITAAAGLVVMLPVLLV